MKDKKNYNSDMPRPSQQKRELGRNSDNEQTQYIKPPDSFSNTLEIPIRQVRRSAEGKGSRQKQQQSRPQTPNNSQGERRHAGMPVNASSRNNTVQKPNNKANDNNKNQQCQNINSNKKQIKKKKGFLGKLFAFVLILLIILFTVYSIFALFCIGKMNRTKINKMSNYPNLISEKHVTNILLIGTDGRTATEKGLSDSVIMVSLNSKTKQTILTSFMRDCYVDINGKGWNKLNASYSFGGAPLLIDTIERNFNVRIDDYVSVNFTSFADIVDAVGGIEIELSDSEAQALNQILHDEVNQIMGDPIDSGYLPGGGKYKLNGKQALSYSRIRYVGNADFERTERQRRVLTEIASEAKTFNPLKLSGMMKAALPSVTTNMSTLELYLMSLKAPFIIGREVKQIQIPAEGTWTSDKDTPHGDVLKVDFDANINMLKEEVFNK